MNHAPKINYYANAEFEKTEHPVITVDSIDGPTHLLITPDGIQTISNTKDPVLKKYTFGDNTVSFPINIVMTCCIIDTSIYMICEDFDWNRYIVKMSCDAYITKTLNAHEISHGVGHSTKIILVDGHIGLIDGLLGLRRPYQTLNYDLELVSTVLYENLVYSNHGNLKKLSFRSYPQPLEGIEKNVLICRVVNGDKSHLKFVRDDGIIRVISRIKNDANESITFDSEGIFCTFGNCAIITNGRLIILFDVAKEKFLDCKTHVADILSICAISRYQFNIIDAHNVTCCYISSARSDGKIVEVKGEMVEVKREDERKIVSTDESVSYKLRIQQLEDEVRTLREENKALKLQIRREQL